MKITSAEFHTSAPDLRSCPPPQRPEFAFIGRSNVGKSSLINLLVHRRDLAKTSSTPGKTRLINFFTINGRWSLVDLPGYGFAAGPKTERWHFGNAVATYLERRETLAQIFVLIDVRLPPQKIDLEFLGWLATKRDTFSIVFTKTDKLSATAGRQSMARFAQALADASIVPQATFATSAKDGDGRQDLLACISRVLAGEPAARPAAEPPPPTGQPAPAA